MIPISVSFLNRSSFSRRMALLGGAGKLSALFDQPRITATESLSIYAVDSPDRSVKTIDEGGMNDT